MTAWDDALRRGLTGPAIAIEYQGEVHSNDRDFGRFPRLRWVNPLA